MPTPPVRPRDVTVTDLWGLPVQVSRDVDPTDPHAVPAVHLAVGGRTAVFDPTDIEGGVALRDLRDALDEALGDRDPVALAAASLRRLPAGQWRIVRLDRAAGSPGSESHHPVSPDRLRVDQRIEVDGTVLRIVWVARRTASVYVVPAGS